MRREIHPKLFKCEVGLADGTTVELLLTRQISNLKLNVDYTNHPAWNKNLDDSSSFGEVAKFKEKYEDLGI